VADSPEPMLLTVRATARALALSEKTIFNLTKAGRLPAVRVGRAVRYALVDVRAFVKAAKGVTP